jgi:hypothetical protein
VKTKQPTNQRKTQCKHAGKRASVFVLMCEYRIQNLLVMIIFVKIIFDKNFFSMIKMKLHEEFKKSIHPHLNVQSKLTLNIDS